MAQTVSTKLPDSLISQIDKLVECGEYLNRSEFLRESARQNIIDQRGIFKGKAKKEQLTRKDREKIWNEFVREKGWDL